MGETTVGLRLPGSEIELLLDQDAPEGDKPGPFFQVDDVDAFFEQRKDELAFVGPPKSIPPGRYVAFDDPWGNRVHVLDLSADGQATRVAAGGYRAAAMLPEDLRAVPTAVIVEPTCVVCRKHGGVIGVPGGAIYDGDLLCVGHVQLREGADSAYLGHLLVESRRPRQASRI